MRLVCPNCAAQYEVDPALIPEGGRDVQCSSCGETWFTTLDGAAAEPPAPTRPQPVPPAAPDHMPPTGQEDRSDDAPEPAAPPPRRRIDEAALAILRE
ncbi:MAG: zinc-ribbon domain-containing protein, partial [Tranquillimonas sp.]